MSTSEEKSDKEVANEVLSRMPESATFREILVAINNQNDLKATLEVQKHIEAIEPLPERGSLSQYKELLGCLFGICLFAALFTLMPLFFSFGELIAPRPNRPTVQGTVISLQLAEGEELAECVGKKCRVDDSCVIIETANGFTIIPSARIRRLDIEK